MRSRFCLLLLGAAGMLLPGACEPEPQGSPAQNQPPETFTVVDTIVRTGEQRFPSLVELRWWGSDPDGLVAGFELFDQQSEEWNFTTRTDSTIQVVLPRGAETLDYELRVRAVDEEGARDQSPARLVVPVKNTPPQMRHTTNLSGDSLRLFPVLRYEFQASDPDGASNLRRIEIVLEDTTREPFELGPEVSTLTLVAVDPTADSTDFRVLVGAGRQEAEQTLVGTALDGPATLYLRSVDLTDTASPWVAGYTAVLERQRSGLLLVNDFSGSQFRDVDRFYTQVIEAAGFSEYDLKRFNNYRANGKQVQELPREPATLERVLTSYEALIWYAAGSGSLTRLRAATNAFFAAGKKVFFIGEFSLVDQPREGAFDFTPIQNLVDYSEFEDFNQTLLPPDSALKPLLEGYPRLVSGSFQPIIPFESKPTSDIQDLYEGALLADGNQTGNWPGPSTLVTVQRGDNGSRFALAGIDFRDVNKNDSVPAFFEQLLVNEFGLEP